MQHILIFRILVLYHTEIFDLRISKYMLTMSKLQLCLTLKPMVFLNPKADRTEDEQPLIFEEPVKKNISSTEKKKILNETKNSEKKSIKKNQKNVKEFKEKFREKYKEKEKLRCVARIANGSQCGRSKNPITGTDFCKCHEKHCPHGRIDGPLEGKFLNVPKKRGPKFKNCKDYTVNDLNTDLYVQTQLVKIDQSLYLIDLLGLLYSNDVHGEIVGRRVGDEIHWYR